MKHESNILNRSFYGDIRSTDDTVMIIVVSR